MLTLFAGYPIISHYTDNKMSTNGAYNLGGINSTGQIPLIANFPSLIDPDTPPDAMTRTGFDNNQWDLVFSDEFNKDGRTFFDGDDPFWTAVGEFSPFLKPHHIPLHFTRSPFHSHYPPALSGMQHKTETDLQTFITGQRVISNGTTQLAQRPKTET